MDADRLLDQLEGTPETALDAARWEKVIHRLRGRLEAGRGLPLSRLRNWARGRGYSSPSRGQLLALLLDTVDRRVSERLESDLIVEHFLTGRETTEDLDRWMGEVGSPALGERTVHLRWVAKTEAQRISLSDLFRGAPVVVAGVSQDGGDFARAYVRDFRDYRARVLGARPASVRVTTEAPFDESMRAAFAALSGTDVMDDEMVAELLRALNTPLPLGLAPLFDAMEAARLIAQQA
jgi:hypothetical protein